MTVCPFKTKHLQMNKHSFFDELSAIEIYISGVCLVDFRRLLGNPPQTEIE